MNINENTKILARFHREPNNRGLSIYNPYFQEKNVNAAYVLFHDPDPAPLVQGMRNLNLVGAISAGFEHNPDMPPLMDELTPIAQKLGRVGLIINDNGRLIGDIQGSKALYDLAKSKTDINGKKIVIMGAGDIVLGLLEILKLNGDTPNIEIYNRTASKAESLASEYHGLISKAGPLNEMGSANGDIFFNATAIGSPWNKGDDYVFTEKFVGGFEYIFDVTFVPLRPQLVQIAEKLEKNVSPGWEMFLWQGTTCLEWPLGITVDKNVLGRLIRKDFETNWS